MPCNRGQGVGSGLSEMGSVLPAITKLHLASSGARHNGVLSNLRENATGHTATLKMQNWNTHLSRPSHRSGDTADNLTNPFSPRYWQNGQPAVRTKIRLLTAIRIGDDKCLHSE